MEISCAKFRTYIACPLRYRYQYVDHLKKPQQNEYHTVSGTVVGRIFEHFYNDEIWRFPKEVQEKLLELLPKEYEAVLAKSNVIWNDKTIQNQLSKEELLEDCKKSVLSGLKAIKENLLLGKYARSEVKLQAKVNNYDIIWGRADIIIRRQLKDQPEEILLIDGKNTKHDQYLDEQQLLFYALTFYLANERMVDKLGYLLFRKGEVKWIEFDKEDLQKLKEQIAEVSKGISKKEFEPTFTPQACKFCLYKEECEKETGWAVKTQSPKKFLRVIPDGVTEIGF